MECLPYGITPILRFNCHSACRQLSQKNTEHLLPVRMTSAAQQRHNSTAQLKS